jgi:hypothetical protein
MAKKTVSDKVAALGDLTRQELIGLWIKRFGIEPPLGIRQPMLQRAAAWHIQEQQFGGLSRAARQRLRLAMKRVAIANVARSPDTTDVKAETIDPASAGQRACARNVPSPGARLVREWNGRRYVVEVIEGGFIMDGKPYRSLSAIALRITGAKWSGPRFFGL